MRKFLACGFVLSLALALPALQAGSDDQKATREALQALQDYIGGWNGNGTSDKDTSKIWKEKVEWSWRFKGKDAWLSLTMDKSELFRKGELRWLPADETYQLKLVDAAGKEKVFTGEFKRSFLILEHKNPTTREVEQLKFNIAGGGIRQVFQVWVKPAGRTLFNRQYLVSYTKDGESFGAAKKQNECVVTGGLGTMAVSYMGMTYYVCCSGCRDAFNENPAKIIAEYKAKKRKGG